jgi:hypothetical protein
VVATPRGAHSSSLGQDGRPRNLRSDSPDCISPPAQAVPRQDRWFFLFFFSNVVQLTRVGIYQSLHATGRHESCIQLCFSSADKSIPTIDFYKSFVDRRFAFRFAQSISFSSKLFIQSCANPPSFILDSNTVVCSPCKARFFALSVPEKNSK